MPESLTLLPREVDDFLRGGNHSKHMPPLTYLAWLQPIYYNSRFVFIHINITKLFTCGENFDKKIFFFQVQFLKILFFSRFSFENIIFFQVQFWKYYFFPGSVLKIFFFPCSVLKIFFSRFSFENIYIFFQVQFLN